MGSLVSAVKIGSEYLCQNAKIVTLPLLMTIVLPLFVVYIYRRPRNLPPGPLSLPFVGNLWRVLTMRNISDELKPLSDIYGPVMWLKLGGYRAVVLSSCDVIHEAFVTRSYATSGRPISVMKYPTGILMKEGERWKSMRRFSVSALRDFGYGGSEIQDRIINESTFMKEQLETAEQGVYREMKRLCSAATANIVSYLLFGCRFDYDNVNYGKVLAAINSLLREYNPLDVTHDFDKFPILPLQRRRLWVMMNNMIDLRGFIIAQIDAHKADFDANNVRDYVDATLRVKQESSSEVDFTEEEMFAAIIDLFIAGTETTAATLAWAFLYMIAFPEVQERCQSQIDEVVEGNREVRLQDRSQLPYVEATLLEIQRYSSVVALAVTHRATMDTTIGGYNIPRDTLIFPNLLAAHYDKNKFEAPLVFRPERFLDADGEVINADYIIPFSTGPRVCMGEHLARSEMFLFFANLLNHFTFSKVPDTHLDLTPSPDGPTNREPRDYIVKTTTRHT